MPWHLSSRESATISCILDKAKSKVKKKKENHKNKLWNNAGNDVAWELLLLQPSWPLSLPKNWVSFGTRSCAYWLPAESLLVEDLCRTRPLFLWAHRLHSTCTVISTQHTHAEIRNRKRLWSATSDSACSWYEWLSSLHHSLPPFNNPFSYQIKPNFKKNVNAADNDNTSLPFAMGPN